MSFWVAVVFFCAPGDCAFWKAEEVFDSKAQCEKSLTKALDVFENHSEIASGACLQIRLAKT